jgi:two-component sensor histidine kinase
MTARPVRLITVDDNPFDRQLVRHEAEALFPDAVIVECGGKQAFEEALEAGEPDLVVTDLDLKGASGREIFALSRAAFPTCPVIMFTNSGDETTAVEMMKAGLDDYVVKSARQLPRLRTSMRIVVEAARTRIALTDRERRLASALEHQQTIVRELHHRVKNNLQTITSLLQLRARGASPETALALDELAGRMRALAAVQTRIYDTELLDRVDFAQVLSEVSETLTMVREGGRIGFVRDFDGPLDLDVARAMPLALLCYEVILNALKHAWPENENGKLVVTLRSRADPIEIRIGDDGVGFMDGDVVKGLGSRLTRALAKEAVVEVVTTSRPGEGTTVLLRLL